MPANLLDAPVQVVNIGLAGFARDLATQGQPVQQVDWSPPARGNAELAHLLASLAGRESDILVANAEAMRRMLDADPVLVDVRTAGDVIPALGERVILHAGPPIQWSRMCGPLRGAIAGAIVYEGWASSLEEATRMAAAGDIAFHPNHHFDAVGPMTGMITQSMPLYVVENRAFGNRAY
jgi:hypothetical protein